ncbi:MAG: hypothetical protein JST30_09485 [Armatimonadetes bacterium]|nr:hypothetical protein [Armatimonadota bacterium]
MIPFLLSAAALQSGPELRSDGLHGYINARVQDPPSGYGFGVSLYSSAWPLLKKPVAGFQIGLASTWILPDNRSVKEPLVPHGTVARDSMPERGPSFWTVFQTIEGGLGFWTSNRYFAPTAKFRMNGSIDGYNHEVSSPGWDFYGRPLPGEYMGIAQLSPRVLVPPDGITLAAGTNGQVLGYAWMALPLIAPKETPVKTGGQCWTAFLNAANFRGPVAFYLPSIWSKMSQGFAPAVGRGLDALPGLASSGAIEIGGVPQWVGPDDNGVRYHKIPELQFPVDPEGRTVLFRDMTAYSKEAIWNDVADWAQGGPAPSGRFDPKGAFRQKLTANPLLVEQGGKTQAEGIGDWVKTVSPDEYTFGLEWDKSKVTPGRRGFGTARFPSYFRHDGGKVKAVAEADVPIGSGLKSASFPSPDTTQSYVPSENGEGVWKTPGPRSGPFKAKLADKSVVTYYWYRFIDQPSLQNCGLSVAEKDRLQALVEKIHREWTTNKTYMAPPKQGRLAALDTAVLVQPPKGLEVGYVPVAVRQDPVK